jgi:hypothetical protein
LRWRWRNNRKLYKGRRSAGLGRTAMLFRNPLGVIALAAALLMTVAAAKAHDESKYPDWSGQWRRVPDGGPPRYDPSKRDGPGQQAPLTEEYKRIHEASMKEQSEGKQGLYLRSVKCIPMGMPYTMSIVFPFEFVITDKTTFILFEIMTSQPRRIYTDGRPWPQDVDPAARTFNGLSMGKWIDDDGDGKYDVLESETRFMRLPRTFDQTGIAFHEDGKGVITERIYLDKTNPKFLYNEMTTVDSALTRPWSVKKKYERLPRVDWVENNCTEGNSDVVVGKEQYMVSGDEMLMPTRKNQPAPDLRYFK